MKITLPPLPHPIQYEHREPRERYTADQMHAYSADALERQAVANADEVIRLRERIRVLLAPGGGIEDGAARIAELPAESLDCRTCSHYRVLQASCHYQPCNNADRYDPLPPVKLWGKT